MAWSNALTTAWSIDGLTDLGMMVYNPATSEDL